MEREFLLIARAEATRDLKLDFCHFVSHSKNLMVEVKQKIFLDFPDITLFVMNCSLITLASDRVRTPARDRAALLTGSVRPPSNLALRARYLQWPSDRRDSQSNGPIYGSALDAGPTLVTLARCAGGRLEEAEGPCREVCINKALRPAFTYCGLSTGMLGDCPLILIVTPIGRKTSIPVRRCGRQCESEEARESPP